MGNEFQGYRLHYRVSDAESAWGTQPGTPDWKDVPQRNNGFQIDEKAAIYWPDVNVGGFMRAVGIKNTNDISGSINSLLYPDSAERLLNMVLDRDSDDSLKSYTIQKRDPLEQRAYYGCMVNQGTISFDQGGEVGLAMDIIGKQGADASAEFTADPTYTTQVPFKFQDGVMELPDGTVVGTIESGSITIANGLQPGPFYGSTQLLSYLVSGSQVVNGSAVIAFNVTTYLTALRAGTTSSFEIVLTHPTETTDGKITILIPKMLLPDVPVRGGLGEVRKQTINFEVEQPTSGDQIQATVEDVV